MDTLGLPTLRDGIDGNLVVSLKGSKGAGTSQKHEAHKSTTSSKSDWESTLEGVRPNLPGHIVPHWETVFEVYVTKVPQDDPFQEIYKDDQNTYFGTTRLLTETLPNLQVLVVESFGGKPSRIRDRFGNEYRTLDWSEVRSLTLKGQPLFTHISPTKTARPNEPAYTAQTIEPSMHNQGFNWAPSLAMWNTPRPVNPAPRPVRPPVPPTRASTLPQ